MSPFARWAVSSISAALGTGLVLRYAAPLADPVSCPGLIEWLAVIASRTWRDVPLGSMLFAGNAVMLFVALLLLARVTHTLTSSIIIAASITMAAAASAVFVLALAPSPAVAFATTAAAWTAILRARRERQSIARARIALGLLALLAATVVPFMIPAAILAVWLAWRFGWLHAALAPVGVLAPAIVVQLALPQGPSTAALSYLPWCVIPHGGVAALIEAGRPFGSVIAANPVATVLAILGLVSLERVPRDVARSLLPLTLLAFWGAMIMPAQSTWLITPFVVAFWILAAAGLAEVWGAVGRTTGGKVGAVALSVLLVVLQLTSTNAHRDDTPPRDGHDRLSVTMMGALVGAIPRGGALVEEDATTDLLTRALPGRVRSSDRFHVVARRAGAIAESLRGTRVFALPRSQRELQYAGFEMISAGVPGLAEIRQAHPCTTYLGAEPSSLEPILGQRQFGLVADTEQRRDQVVIVFAADSPLAASPVGWPRSSKQNIQGRMFDLTLAVDQADFAEEIRKYQLSSWPRPDTRYATRIEIRRSHGDPLVLPIALGEVAKAGTARVLDSSPRQHVRLCPAFPYEVQPLVRRP